MVSRGWIFAAGLVAVSCKPSPRTLVQEPTPDSASVRKARAVADSLGDELMGALAMALDRGGPALAIHFCADSAQVRTLRHWKDGVYIRRVSERIRNVDDTPDTLERRGLEQLAAAYRAGRLPEEVVSVTRGADGTYQLQYLRPLLVKPPCLACHGDPATFAPEVRAVLARRYPQDQATGYAVGDLRGAISVRVPLAPVSR
jgi:hypothetical protein